MNNPDSSAKRPVPAGEAKSSSVKRKPATDRRRDLELAISRIKRGRARTKETTISISSVAREAGVTPALIHNHYPSIAEEIRVLQGRSSRAYRDVKHSQLKAERDRNSRLQEEVNELRESVRRLASINEVLVAENRVLRAKKNDARVSEFPLKQDA